jgi:hypothetical protein
MTILRWVMHTTTTTITTIHQWIMNTKRVTTITIQVTAVGIRMIMRSITTALKKPDLM